MKITAKHFKKSVGVNPQDDDLTRSNCPQAGQLMHSSCGWDVKRDMPNFIPGEAHYKKSKEFCAYCNQLPGFKGKHFKGCPTLKQI